MTLVMPVLRYDRPRDLNRTSFKTRKEPRCGVHVGGFEFIVVCKIAVVAVNLGDIESRAIRILISQLGAEVQHRQSDPGVGP